MHDRLAAAMTSQLSQPAKVLYSLLYALNGNGSGALPIPDVLAMLNYKHIGSLRGVASNASGRPGVGDQCGMGCIRGRIPCLGQ